MDGATPGNGRTSDWVSERRFHCADAFLNLLLPFIGRFLRKVLVRPGVGANRMPGFIHLSKDFGIIGRVLADREKRCLDALVGQRLEHGLGVVEPRPVIKGQHHFARPKEVVLSEMLEAEARPAGRVDLDHPRDAERVGIGPRWTSHCSGGRSERRQRGSRGTGSACLDCSGLRRNVRPGLRYNHRVRHRHDRAAQSSGRLRRRAEGCIRGLRR